MLARRSRLLAAGALVALVSACSDRPATAPHTRELPPLTTTQLDSVFARASVEFGVPADLLKAISFTETRWQMVQGAVEFEGVPAAFGLMALRGRNLSDGARLANAPEPQVKADALANVRAAAALLDRWATEANIDRADLGAWAPIVARYSGITQQ